MIFAATCLFGLEKFLNEELDALGVKRLSSIDGRTFFEGGPEEICRCSIGLRFAERLFIVVGSCDTDVPNPFDAFFEGIKAMPFEDYIGPNDTFTVSGHAVKSRLTSIPACQRVAQKAIAERLSKIYRKSWFDGDGCRFSVEFFILENKAWLMIDTSGVALHKRGYRPQSNAAPLRETLAAALCRIARPREDVLFWDPMCGSGTIAVEAALMMTNTAPGLNRSFAAESFPFLPAALWKKAREEAADLVRRDSAFECYASDIDPACVQLTRDNVHRAGMGKYIKAFERDALDITTGGRRGTVVCNPPYGERLLTPEECRELYRKMGRHFALLDRWQIYILCADEEFEKFYGRKADKVRVLYNGMIRCGCYQFFKPKDRPETGAGKKPAPKPGGGKNPRS